VDADPERVDVRRNEIVEAAEVAAAAIVFAAAAVAATADVREWAQLADCPTETAPGKATQERDYWYHHRHHCHQSLATGHPK
jgi:hypothetical protein